MQIGISQTQLGRLEDLTFQQIQKYETGKNRIGAVRLYRFSKILHVNISYFFDGLEALIENKLTNNTSTLNITELEKINTHRAKFDTEIKKLNSNFLKIKDIKIRKSVIELARQLAESEENIKKINH
jgi:transcriptional regulator with XRE-family HTH domain